MSTWSEREAAAASWLPAFLETHAPTPADAACTTLKLASPSNTVWLHGDGTYRYKHSWSEHDDGGNGYSYAAGSSDGLGTYVLLDAPKDNVLFTVKRDAREREGDTVAGTLRGEPKVCLHTDFQPMFWVTLDYDVEVSWVEPPNDSLYGK